MRVGRVGLIGTGENTRHGGFDQIEDNDKKRVSKTAILPIRKGKKKIVLFTYYFSLNLAHFLPNFHSNVCKKVRRWFSHLLEEEK